MRTEADLVAVVEKSFEKRGFVVNTEIPMLSKRIDLLCVRPNTNELIAIEAKIQKWKRAFQQALTYRLCSDFVYIAIHNNYSHLVKIDMLQKYGVGLIVVDEDDIEMPLEALPSAVTHQRLKEDVMRHIGGERSVPL